MDDDWGYPSFRKPPLPTRHLHVSYTKIHQTSLHFSYTKIHQTSSLQLQKHIPDIFTSVTQNIPDVFTSVTHTNQTSLKTSRHLQLGKAIHLSTRSTFHDALAAGPRAWCARRGAHEAGRCGGHRGHGGTEGKLTATRRITGRKMVVDVGQINGKINGNIQIHKDFLWEMEVSIESALT